jgi:hypothetical protein
MGATATSVAGAETETGVTVAVAAKVAKVAKAVTIEAIAVVENSPAVAATVAVAVASAAPSAAPSASPKGRAGTSGPAHGARIDRHAMTIATRANRSAGSPARTIGRHARIRPSVHHAASVSQPSLQSRVFPRTSRHRSVDLAGTEAPSPRVTRRRRAHRDQRPEPKRPASLLYSKPPLAKLKPPSHHRLHARSRRSELPMTPADARQHQRVSLVQRKRRS